MVKVPRNRKKAKSIHSHSWAHPFTWGTSIFMGHIHFHGAPIDLLNVLVSPWIQIVIHSWVRGWLDCMLGGWAGHICWGRLFARLGALAAAKFLHHYFHVKVSQDITTHTHTQIQTLSHSYFKHTFLTQLSSFNAPLFHWNKFSTLFIFRESPGFVCFSKLNITSVRKSIKANNSKSKFESLAPIILS